MINKILSNNTLSMLTFAAIVVIISILLLNFAFQSTLDRVEWEEKTYYVNAGESLWSISAKFCPNNVDAREWIEEVKTLNHMQSSNLYAGDTLIVLVPTTQEG